MFHVIIEPGSSITAGLLGNMGVTLIELLQSITVRATNLNEIFLD